MAVGLIWKTWALLTYGKFLANHWKHLTIQLCTCGTDTKSLFEGKRMGAGQSQLYKSVS